MKSQTRDGRNGTRQQGVALFWVIFFIGMVPGLLSQESGGRSSGTEDSILSAGESPTSMMKPSTSRQCAAEAVGRIPWNGLAPTDRKLAESLVANPSLYRRLPMTTGICNPEIYDFLLCHPEAVIGLWRALGYAKIDMSEIAPGHYRMREESGTTAEVRMLYHDNHRVVAHCRGIYRGTLSPRPLSGEALVVLQYRFTEDVRNRNEPVILSRLDTFIRIDNPGIDILSRAFGPLVGKIVDSNFVKTVEFVDHVSATAERNPEGLGQTVRAITNLRPDLRDEFLSIIDRAPYLAMLRHRGERVDYYLLAKANVAEMSVARLLSRQRTPGGMPETTPETLLESTSNVGGRAVTSVEALAFSSPLVETVAGVKSSSESARESVFGAVSPPVPFDSQRAFQISATEGGDGVLSHPSPLPPAERVTASRPISPPVPNRLSSHDPLESIWAEEDSDETSEKGLANSAASLTERGIDFSHPGIPAVPELIVWPKPNPSPLSSGRTQIALREEIDEKSR